MVEAVNGSSDKVDNDADVEEGVASNEEPLSL